MVETPTFAPIVPQGTRRSRYISTRSRRSEHRNSYVRETVTECIAIATSMLLVCLDLFHTLHVVTALICMCVCSVCPCTHSCARALTRVPVHSLVCPCCTHSCARALTRVPAHSLVCPRTHSCPKHMPIVLAIELKAHSDPIHPPSPSCVHLFVCMRVCVCAFLCMFVSMCSGSACCGAVVGRTVTRTAKNH